MIKKKVGFTACGTAGTNGDEGRDGMERCSERRTEGPGATHATHSAQFCINSAHRNSARRDPINGANAMDEIGDMLERGPCMTPAAIPAREPDFGRRGARFVKPMCYDWLASLS